MDRGQWSPEAKVPLAPRGEASLSGSPRERRHTQMQKGGTTQTRFQPVLLTPLSLAGPDAGPGGSDATNCSFEISSP